MKNSVCTAASSWWTTVGSRLAKIGVAVSLGAALVVSPAAALPAQSWAGYHWARTGLLNIQLGFNVAAAWEPAIETAVHQWNVATNLNYVAVDGMTTAGACDPVWGTTQICSANYGATRWLGLTSLYLYGSNGNLILGAKIQLNEYYYGQAKYNTAAWRAMTACQELGNALGLADADRNTGNANTGSCMDYTNNPAPAKGRLANTAPSASDLTNLNAIYAKPDGSQLAETTGIRLVQRVMFDDNAAVPEPASWAMMLAGFAAIGTAMRRRPTAAAA